MHTIKYFLKTVAVPYIFLCIFLGMLGTSIACADVASEASTSSAPNVEIDANILEAIKGWDHAFGLLKNAGLADELLLGVFSDERMPVYSPIQFKVAPTEKHLTDNYKKRNSYKERAEAFEFYTEHKKDFLEAEKKYGVPASIILAILQIETKCGKVTGNSIVFHKLAWLASASSEQSIRESFDMNLKNRPGTTLDEVEKRAKKLEDIFLPQVIATFKLAEIDNVHPLDIKGSYAGAVGFPQFLPNNIFVYGVDGNNDGIVDLYNPSDAIHSVGNFLSKHGWKKKNYTKEEKEKLILHYNRSAPYVRTVVEMATILSGMMGGKPNPQDPQPAKKATKAKGAVKQVKKK